MTINLESIMRRIAALSEKTLDNGCTEAEALGAAEKVASMLAEHGLSLSDIEIEERKDCEQDEIDTGRKRAHAIENVVANISEFCDVKVWRARHRGGFIRYCFFGFPEDVAAAKAMYGMILNAMDCALIEFKATGSTYGRRSTNAFSKGMAGRLSRRLHDMKQAQRKDTQETTGRDLVVVKSNVVDEAYGKLNMRLRSQSRKSTYSDGEAYAAGQAAGNRVNFNKGVTGGSQARLS